MEKKQIIANAEEQFAREVTLGVIVQKPPPVWQTLIPGMFIIDFLRRSSAIRQYTKYFMFPRKLAMDTAQALAGGQDKAAINSRIDAEIANRLNALHLFSPELARLQKVVVDFLIDHYRKLFEAEGYSYYDLIRSAYASRDEYEEHLHRLSSAEKELDRAIIERLGNNHALREKLQTEEQQIRKRRQKILDEIF
jgi:hypothetical protein